MESLLARYPSTRALSPLIISVIALLVLFVACYALDIHESQTTLLVVGGIVVLSTLAQQYIDTITIHPFELTYLRPESMNVF